MEAPCSDFDGGSATCISTGEPLPSVRATKDSIIIRFESKENIANSTIQLRGCYSAYSSEDRPWRKQEDVVDDNLKKRCSVAITKNLSISELDNGEFGGEYVWTPGSAVGPSIYTVQALEVCSNGTFCAYGQAPGFFEVIPIDSTPSWLRAVVGILIPLGPLSLFTFMFIESRMKKRA